MKKQANNPEQNWLAYEQEAQASGHIAVCGVDEAGRGPLAGPVSVSYTHLDVYKRQVWQRWGGSDSCGRIKRFCKHN